MKHLISISILITVVFSSIAQQTPEPKGYFSGTLMMNANFYQRDTIRGTQGPVYDSYLSGGDAWLNVDYHHPNFDAGIRFDAYQNSILFNPLGAYTGQGLAIFYIKANVDKLTIRGGHVYDQFGSGLIFRSYEQRGLGIDNALFGIHLKYDINDNWMVKAFTGMQKFRFSLHQQVIKGINSEYSLRVNDQLSTKFGGAVVNRTLDQATMNQIVNEINAYPLEERFIPKYNVYAYSAYANIYYGNFSLYGEYAGKTSESILNNDGTQLLNKPGSIIYANGSYSVKGFGVTTQFRRIETFPMRTSPYQTLLNGLVNYAPTFSPQRTYRLISRYNAVANEIGEMAYQVDLFFTPTKKHTINVSLADIRDLSNTLLYREGYVGIKSKLSKKLKTVIGVQHLLYNQLAFEGKGNVVEALSPLAEISYRLKKKKSIRTELQYQHNKQDFGSWVYGLLEYNIAPNYSFSISDMYNFEPKKTEALHYYSFAVSLTQKATKLTVSYVKQVEGVVCTGGICRFQPAFSGGIVSLTTSF